MPSRDTAFPSRSRARCGPEGRAGNARAGRGGPATRDPIQASSPPAERRSRLAIHAFSASITTRTPNAIAAIDLSALAFYAYETGNDSSASGIDWVELDADEQAGRVPTIVQATSRVREYGVDSVA